MEETPDVNQWSVFFSTCDLHVTMDCQDGFERWTILCSACSGLVFHYWLLLYAQNASSLVIKRQRVYDSVRVCVFVGLYSIILYDKTDCNSMT